MPQGAPLTCASDLIRQADAILAGPPRYELQLRHAGRGELIARAALPLTLLPTTNRTRGKQAWQFARHKAAVYQVLAAQLPKRAEPLMGRPHVRCVRFSAVEPDAYNDGFKVPVDCLCCRTTRGKLRLGWLLDDSPRFALVTQHWEFAPRGEGFGLIEIWSGDTDAH